MPLVTDSAIVALNPGVSVVITHGVEQGGLAFIPNAFVCTPPHPLRVTASNQTTCTVINDDPQDAYTGSLRSMCLHSIQAPVGVSAVGQTMSIRGISAADKTSIVTSLTRHRGTCMMNRLFMLGVPGIIVQTNTVTIGADVYEFRDSSPPIGGTAGRIWVFNGTGGAPNAVISRANFILAVNGGGTANEVTRTSPANPTAGTNTELVRAYAGVTAGVINVVSAATIGGVNAPSAVATATTETLATLTDVWDAATMYNGVAAGQKNVGYATLPALVALTHIAKGNIQTEFPFTPTKFIVVNRLRSQNEAVAIVGNAVSITLGGGAPPANQVADIIDIIAFG
jgi:hypothetical protein